MKNFFYAFLLKFILSAALLIALSAAMAKTISTTDASIGGEKSALESRLTDSISKTANHTEIKGIVVLSKIITLTVTGSPFCVTSSRGTSTNVSFITEGIFTQGNLFTVQLSDLNGSFASPKVIGSGTTSPITATLPANIPSGNRYRVRVVSLSLSIIGTDNDNDLRVNLFANSIFPLAEQTINTDTDGMTLTVTESFPATREWLYSTVVGGAYTTSLGVNDRTFTPHFETAGTYYVVCVSTFGGGCSVTSKPVRITVLPATTPIVTSPVYYCSKTTVEPFSRTFPQS